MWTLADVHGWKLFMNLLGKQICDLLPNWPIWLQYILMVCEINESVGEIFMCNSERFS